MNDSSIMFALVAVAVLGWAYAFAMAHELKRLRTIADGRKVAIDELMSDLQQAQKNDSRNPKTGRYVANQ